MPHAVIVAHGQPSDPEPAEAALATLARKVDALCEQVTVTSATLAAPRALETCLDALPDGTLVYPLFMARGWFVTSALPKRIGARPVNVLDPMGTDPTLPALVADALTHRMSALGWAAKTTDLVIAAHGSGRSQNPAKIARDFGDELGQLIPFQSLRVGFVEQPPSISEAARDAGPMSICLPFFACAGGHVLEDIPQELALASFEGHVMPVIGDLVQVQRQIAATLDGCAS